MLVLGQRDPRWSNVHLGNSSLLVGQYGCTTTCISMLSDYFGNYHTPGEIADPHYGFQQYTPDGLIMWETLKISPMQFKERLHERNDAKILESIKDPKKAVILEVDHHHWVVALSKVPLLNVYRIADPWTATKRFSSAYGQITGSAHFFKP